LVVVELLIGRPLFPGNEEEEQLRMITELLGEPEKVVVRQGKRYHEFFFEGGKIKVGDHSRIPGLMNLKEVLQSSDHYLIDFIMKCLTWEARIRMTTSQAMKHPWNRMNEVQISSNTRKSLPRLRNSEKK
jgi:dual specificity tyrosine-phosphorylation-regulated kinase 2/3/4